MLQRSFALSLTAMLALAVAPLGCGDSGTTTSGSGGGTTTSTGGGGSTTTSTGGGGSTGSFTTTGGGGSTASTGGGGSAASTGGGGSTASTGGGGAGGAGGGTTVGGGMMASDQIAAILATADGTGLTLPIEGAFVTYVKPTIGTDPAGFFLQAEQVGPAIFIAVDPATLTPVPQVGDLVDLTVTDIATVTGLKQATGVSGFSVTSSGHSIAPLVTDITAATDVLTNLDGYSSRVVSFDADIVGAFVAAGAPQVAAPISTTGLTDPNFRIRMPETVRAMYDLQDGCSVAVDYGPMWRFNTVAQPSTLDAADIVAAVCPDPTVAGAVAGSATTVIVTFDRALDPATVQASDFTFNNGLTASSVVVSADGKSVTITTSAQTAGQMYTVTAATLTDVLGAPVGMPNMATFTGFVTPAVVRINELNANITGGCDLIELRAIAGGSMEGFTITERTGGSNELNMTFAGLTVAKNDYVVVHLNGGSVTCNPGAVGNETTSKTQFVSVANYATAFDWYATDTGLTSTDNVIQIKDAAGNIVDAVLVADAATGTAAANSETAAAAVAAANQWTMPGGGVPVGGFVDDAFRANAVLDLNATGTTAVTSSIQRTDDLDSNSLNGWTTGAGVASTWGANNAGQADIP